MSWNQEKSGTGTVTWEGKQTPTCKISLLSWMLIFCFCCNAFEMCVGRLYLMHWKKRWRFENKIQKQSIFRYPLEGIFRNLWCIFYIKIFIFHLKCIFSARTQDAGKNLKWAWGGSEWWSAGRRSRRQWSLFINHDHNEISASGRRCLKKSSQYM